MRALSVLLLCLTGTVLTAIGSRAWATVPDPVATELKEYLARKDLIVRGVLLRVERQRGSTDGRWTIVIAKEKTLKGPAGVETITLFSLVTPPPCEPNSEVLAYASKTKSDDNRLWGNYFSIKVLPDGSESLIVGDNAIPALSRSRRVDYASLVESVRLAVRDPITGERVIPYDDIVAVFSGKSAKANR